MDPENSKNQENLTLEERLERVPMDEREKLEKSWNSLRSSMPEIEPEKGIQISKIEWSNPEERKKKVEEMQEFLLKAFEGEEMVDSMQMEIGMQHGIVDYYAARDEQGKLMSLLSSQLVETKNKAGESELSMIFWYVANDPEYKGRSVAKGLGTAALTDFLKRAQDQLKPVKAILGEAEMGDEDEAKRERAFNRYAGMDRLYGKKKNGELFEVLYEAPPEDESTKGAPAHFMVRMVDGSKTISQEDYMELVKGIHSQYTRDEYFTPEYYAFMSGVSPKLLKLAHVAQMYHKRYKKITEKIDQKLEKKVNEAQGDLVLLSEREKRALDSQ